MGDEGSFVSLSTAASGLGEREDSADAVKVVVGAGTDVITVTMASLEKAVTDATEHLHEISELRLIAPLVVGMGAVVKTTMDVATELSRWAESLVCRNNSFKHLVDLYDRCPKNDDPILVDLLEEAVEAHKERTLSMEIGNSLVLKLENLVSEWKSAEKSVIVARANLTAKITNVKKNIDWLHAVETGLTGAAILLGCGCVVIGCNHFLFQRSHIQEEETSMVKSIMALACVLMPLTGIVWREKCREKINAAATTMLALRAAEMASSEILEFLRAVHAQLSELLSEVQTQIEETGVTLEDTEMLVSEEGPVAKEETAQMMELQLFKRNLKQGTESTLLYLRHLESDKKSLLTEQIHGEIAGADRLRCQAKTWKKSSVKVSAGLEALCDVFAFAKEDVAKEESAKGKDKDQVKAKE